MVISGILLIPNWINCILCIVCLSCLFLGVYITTGILNESIDVITSTQTILKSQDPLTMRTVETKIKLWNPVIASLTIMVVGTSAPQILLILIEAFQSVGYLQRTHEDIFKFQKDLIGPSVIFGSAAFNTFFVTAICVFAPNPQNDIVRLRFIKKPVQSLKRDLQVERGIKKINYQGHFFIIFCSTLVVYSWMFIVITLATPNRIDIWEALITIALFIPTLISIYCYDRIRERKQSRSIQTQPSSNMGEHDESSAEPLQGINTLGISMRRRRNTTKAQQTLNSKKKQEFDKDLTDQTFKVMKYPAIEFYRVLISEKKGNPLKNYEEQRKRKEMKEYLKKHLGQEDIEMIQFHELKTILEGEPLIGRIKYRLWVNDQIQLKREIVNRYQFLGNDFSIEAGHEKENPNFGFKCLSYLIRESCGTLELTIVNKKKIQAHVAARAINGTAREGQDFEKIDKSLKIKKDQDEQNFSVKILDNDEWEPDKEFYVELYDPNTGYTLKGTDTRCTIMIIDDDNPGILTFAHKEFTVLATQKEVAITIKRKNGGKGQISCRFSTIELEVSDRKAVPDVDYEVTEGIVEFKHQEITKDVKIKIPLSRQIDPDEYGMRFGVKISDPQPKGVVKLSRDVCIVKIDLDNDFQLRQESLDHYLDTVEKIANRSWSWQIKQAIMLHPTFNLEGEIDDFSNVDALLHFVTIYWKAILACIPPPHYSNGWVAFFCSLFFLGFQMSLIMAVARVFGCVSGIGPSMTGLTVLSAGLSIPDAVTSWKSAIHSKYADDAITQLLCSSTSNAFFGIGVSWLVYSLYFITQHQPYQIDGTVFGIQVILFLIFSIIWVILLGLRRRFLGGELGGIKRWPKILQASLFLSLWFFYVVGCGLYTKIRKT